MVTEINEITLNDGLSSKLDLAVAQAGFSSPYKAERLTNRALYHLINKKFGCDYRAKPTETQQGELTIASTFEGIDFDPKRLRSQTFVITDEQYTDYHLKKGETETVITLPNQSLERGLTFKDFGSGKYSEIFDHKSAIGIMSVVVAPSQYIESEKYYKMQNDKLKFVGFQEAHNLDNPPSFLVIPAWTIVEPKHLTEFAIPGFRAYKRILDTLTKNAPSNTYIEAAAAGKIEGDARKPLFELINSPIGTEFEQNDFPYDFSLLGQNSAGSTSSVKLAQLLGLKQSDNIGSSRSLGPIFVKKLN